MKSVGEAMAIGRNFKESLQKALISLETGFSGLDRIFELNKKQIEKTKIKQPKIYKVENSDPLGSQNKFQPLFNKVNFISNDLIVSSEQLESELSLTEINMILKGGVDRSLSDLFNRVRTFDNLSVCYMAQVDDKPKIPQGAFYLMPEFLNKKFKSSSEMCDSILNNTGVALLPGSDFGFDETKMLARLSFTDFDGQEFMNKIEDNQKIENDHIANLAPKIIEGVNKLKKWSESI